MTNKQIEAELNKIVSDINSVLMGKQNETTGQYKFSPLLVGFRPCAAQLTVFESDVIIKGGVCIDKYEPHQKALVVERTISACDNMIDMLKTHVGKLEEMLTPTPR